MAQPGAIKAGQAFIKIALEDDEFLQDWANFKNKLSGINRVMQRVGLAASAIGVGTIAAFSGIVSAAADAETGTRRFGLIFGANADLMQQRLKQLSRETGYSMTTLMRQSSAFGAIFSELGERLGPTALVETTARAQKAVTDLSGIAGLSMEEAADRIKSALTSTGESVDQFGFNLRQAEINAELQRMGIDKNVRQLSELEKQLVKIVLIQKSIERGQLSFSNMSDTLNARIAILRSSLEELWAVMASLIMPVVKGVVSLLNMLVKIATLPGFDAITALLSFIVAVGGSLIGIVGALALTFGGLATAMVWSVDSLIKINKLFKNVGGVAEAAKIAIAQLSMWFNTLTASIAAANAALLALLRSLALLGFVYVLSQIGNRTPSAEETDITRLERLINRPQGYGWLASLSPRSAMFRQIREAQLKRLKEMAPTAGVEPRGAATGIGGTRMITQQMAYAAGAVSADAATAENTNQLKEMFDSVINGNNTVNTKVES